MAIIFHNITVFYYWKTNSNAVPKINCAGITEENSEKCKYI